LEGEEFEMIQNWIDAVCDVWTAIDAPGFGRVKSPYLVKKAEFPASISPKDDFPIALTIPGTLGVQYSAGGPKEGFYTGVTEFHLTPDLSKTHLPALLPWYGKIWIAAAANMKLGGLVHSFMLNQNDRSIVGPIALAYGDEAEHWGFMVYWNVKEVNNSTVIAGDPSVR
jgi:hypothetical protein